MSELSMTEKSRKLKPKKMKLIRKWINSKSTSINHSMLLKTSKTSSDTLSTFKMKSITREKERKNKKDI
jgi:hypothetical protein